jgi:hypothetical protein
MRVQQKSQDCQIAAQATISTFFYQQQNPILSSFVSLDFFSLNLGSISSMFYAQLLRRKAYASKVQT